MKILLVFPRFKYITGQPPLGIASLYSYLKWKKPDLEIEVFDGTFAKGRSKAFSDLISKNSFDIIGISVMCTMVSDVQALAASARKRSPKAQIIVGGPQATIDPEYFLERDIADIVIVGEGEATFLELVEKEGKPFGVKGVVYKKGGEIVREPGRGPEADINKLPITERMIFDMNSYMAAWNSMDVVNSGLKGTSVMVSRGCPYRCSFCQPTLQKIFGNRIRKYSPERVISELEYLKSHFGIDAFMFEDDTFMMDKEWTARICDLMLERKLGLVWCCNIRADLCDKEILRKMHDAGLRKINIGIESASQYILDEVFRKNVTINQVEVAVKIAKKAGLFVQGYFMIGHPKETRKDILATISFARKLDIDEVSFSITTPLPGTYLYENDRGLAEDGYENYDYYSKSAYKSKSLLVKKWEIKLLKKYAYFMFYLKPRRLRAQLRIFFTVNGPKKFFYKLARV